MEYTDVEKQVLTLMQRTDFKNLSKNDVISYASKLNELRPEVATQVLAQFPEFAKLIQSSLSDYKDVMEKIVSSDDESTGQVYGIIHKELDETGTSRKEFVEFADKVREDLSKCLDNPELSVEERKEIRDQEMEILRMVGDKDKEIRDQEMELVQTANRKDSEKKVFNWKIIGAASFAVLTAIGIGASALGGNFNVKLPKNS